VSALSLADVIEDSRRYGPLAYLSTVSTSGKPYVSPVAVAWRGDELLAFVATAEAKVANVRATGTLCAHFSVSEATNWDSCIVWGDARVADTTTEREQLWGAMGYDLNAFEPGGPSADTHVFIVLQPNKAVIMRKYGMEGSSTWRR
jgi:nitroimidazol reductase NimA-like FMN-containing flavoprotein (pyridoxamine 5'-phosphate oxidase superfamily)